MLKSKWMYILSLLISTFIFVTNQYTYGNDVYVVKTGLSQNNYYERLYHEIKELYDIGEYDKCINKCQKLIKLDTKSIIEDKNYIFLANLYELQADCLERKVEADQAVRVINTLLSRLGQFLLDDHVARVKLKIGHIYEHAGLYSKAISNFKKVEQEYEKIFPDRFAKYARENYNDIISKQVAVISGIVTLEGDTDYSGITIKVFNGFEESETETLQKGEFSVPLFSSTPNTMFSFFAYKQGYTPAIINKKFDGMSKVEMGKIQLSNIYNEDVGIVTGIVFTPILGGKITQHHGIAGYLQKYEVKVQKISGDTYETISLLTDDNGKYIASLAPGAYLIEGKKVDIPERKEVIMLNISYGGIKVD